MIKQRLLMITIMSMICFSEILYAAVPTWEIDARHSTMQFQATQNNVPLKGRFVDFSGDIQFDPAQLQDSKIVIKVNTGTITTHLQEISDMLKTQDWLSVQQYPAAIFTVNHIRQTEPMKFEADGILTIRDKTVQTTIPFTLKEYTVARAHIVGKTSIQRLQFGVGQGEWENVNDIQNDVAIVFDIILVPRKTVSSFPVVPNAF